MKTLLILLLSYTASIVAVSAVEYPGLLSLDERLQVGDTIPVEEVTWLDNNAPAAYPRPPYRIYYIFHTQDHRTPALVAMMNAIHQERSDIADVAFLTFQTSIEIDQAKRNGQWSPAGAVGRISIQVLQKLSGMTTPGNYIVLTDGADKIVWRGLSDHFAQTLRRITEKDFNVDKAATVVRLMDEFHMARQVGNNELAISLLDRILMVDPMQVEAFPIRMSYAERIGDTAGIKRILNRIDPQKASIHEAATVATYLLTNQRLHHRFPEETMILLRRIEPAAGTDIHAANAMLWWFHNVGDLEQMRRQVERMEAMESPLFPPRQAKAIKSYIQSISKLRATKPFSVPE